ncbi:MAG: adenosylcobinamide-GDP ribazoletransferase [Pseudomonadota bacterium]
MTDQTRKRAEVQVAFATLTRLPVGRIAEPVPTIDRGRWAYPLVGVVIGAVSGAVALGAGAVGLPPIAAGLLAVMCSILVTGALHEDGLADCADGFGGGRDRVAKIAIMKDSRNGSFGTLALILSVTLRAAAIGALASPVWAIIAIAAASRFSMVVALENMPAARSDGLGASAATGGSQAPSAGIIALVAIAPMSVIAPSGTLLAIAAMAVTGMVFARIATAQIGGQSGDVLGAIQQVTEITGLLVLSAHLA